MTEWSVYIIKDETDSLYTGVSTDVDRRFREHVEGGPRAAKYLKTKKDIELVFSCYVGDKREAYRIEAKIKTLNKPAKEKIVNDKMDLNTLRKYLFLPTEKAE